MIRHRVQSSFCYSQRYGRGDNVSFTLQRTPSGLYKIAEAEKRKNTEWEFLKLFLNNSVKLVYIHNMLHR